MIEVAAGWVRKGALGAVLVSTGVIVGTYVPRLGARPADPPPPSDGARPAAAPVPAGPVAPPMVISGGPAPQARARPVGIPPAPGFDSFVAAPSRQAFAGEYTVLRGARTVESPAAFPGGSEPPAPASASRTQTAPSRVPVLGERHVAQQIPTAATESAGARAEVSRVSSSSETRGVRRSPAQAIPRGVAAGYPLLALGRSGGRVAFYDLGARAGPTPAAIEGEWSAVGHCDVTALVEFALPTSGRAGELRGIGSGLSGANPELMVARQACGSAAARTISPREPRTGEIERFGGGVAAAGIDPGHLRTVVVVGGVVVLLYWKPGEGVAVIVADATPDANGVVLQRKYQGQFGAVTLVGVYRNGAGADAWFVLRSNDGSTSLIRFSSSDGRNWSADGPLPLGDR